MLHTTPGIVLHSFKYSDTSIVARILTRELGLQSYLVPGVRKSRSRIKASLFQPLSLIEMVAYHKERQGLQRIKEIRCPHPVLNLSADIRKSAIAMFLCEMMLQTFQHQEPQTQAFDYIYKSVLTLDMQERNLSTFHISFLLQLSKFLGFAPGGGYSAQKCFFNLREGVYQHEPDIAGQSLGSEESACFYRLSQTNPESETDLHIPQPIRKTLLARTIDYYRLHMEGFREIKSHQVLDVVFH
jgi:DNA repair protein RecO (recombination protein O)